LSKFDFECCPRLMHDVRYPSNDITWQQAQHQPVRVLKHNRIIDCQAKR
jgi:hypothetical protein